MSAATRLRVMAGAAISAGTIVGIARLPISRDFLSQHIGPESRKYAWRMLAVLFVLFNFKNLPFLWHFRVFRAIIYQLYWQKHDMKPKHLFAPMITKSFNTLYDCDYNIHKSNSTYFADLDVARANYVSCLIRVGLAKLDRGNKTGLPAEKSGSRGSYMIALGGITCSFRRQIPPLQSFEIYTRLLCWDRKWLYLVSHVVKRGAIKPQGYVLQPGKKSKRRGVDVKKEDENLTQHIYATSVARYCFKRGRLTINPEIVLERSELLPPRPAGVALPPRAEMEMGDADTAHEETSTATVNENSDGAESDHVNHNVEQASKGEDEGWTWDDMEQERLRGLKMANHFEALHAVQNELRAGEVLGEYGSDW